MQNCRKTIIAKRASLLKSIDKTFTTGIQNNYNDIIKLGFYSENMINSILPSYN